MKQIFTGFLLLLLSFQIKSQAPRQVIFQGKNVYIYPYRVSANQRSTDNGLLGINENLDIPYYPLSLPDGDYIAYYYLLNTNQVNLKPEDTTNIAIGFSILNGKKNGKASFYTYPVKNKTIYQEGYYKEDEKDGEWNFIIRGIKCIYHYKNGLLDGPVIYSAKYISRTYSFSKGRCDGRVMFMNNKTKEMESYEMSNGKLNGRYYCLLHKSKLNSLRFFPYADNQTVYELLEVEGNFYQDLKYGIWTLTTPDLKLECNYDTVFTQNDNEGRLSLPYSGALPELTPGGFSELLLRTQLYSGTSVYYSANQEVNSFTRLFQNGYGYYRLYQKNGNLLEQDSFLNNAFKSSYTIYDMKGETIGHVERSTRDGIETIDVSSNTGEYSRWIYRHDDFYRLEELSEKSSYGISKTFTRSLLYYKLQGNLLPELIWTDSVVNLDKKGNVAWIQVHWVHTPSSFSYTSFYYHSHEGSFLSFGQPDYKYDSAARTLTEIVRNDFDDLALVDTLIHKSGELHDCNLDSVEISGGIDAHTRWGMYSGHTNYMPDSLHMRVVWKNEPYTGSIVFYTNKHTRYIKSEELKNKTGWTFGNTIVVTVNNSLLLPFSDYNETGIESEVQMEVKEGKMNGPLTFTGFANKSHGATGYPEEVARSSARISHPMKIKNIKLINTELYNYASNLKDGFEEKTSIIMVKRRMSSTFHKPFARFHSSFEEVTEQHEFKNFKNGMLEGNCIQKEEGNIKSIAQYHNGMLNGQMMALASGEQPVVRCVFRNDTLNGLFESYDQNNLRDQLNFVNGLPQGIYRQYQYRTLPPDDMIPAPDLKYCNEIKVNTAVIEFDHGMLINESKFYHCDGILKATVKYETADSVYPWKMTLRDNYICYLRNIISNSDSTGEVIYDEEMLDYSILHYSNRDLSYFLSANERYLFDLDTHLPGYYKYFYKSGVQSQEGRINKQGLKTGWWKYWNENGILMKEIEYKKGFIIAPAGKDTIFYTGIIKGYYPNGKFMMDGYVLDENFKYECVQDEDIAYQDIFYISFVDEQGKKVFSNYTGPVKDFHINGNKREEGMITNTRRTGIWKQYESNGNLAAIGAYREGLKDGLWITGDLSGIGFVDNECLESVIDFNKIRGNLDTSNLNFEETYYENGIVIKQVSHRQTGGY
jgi:antitoxin component YwqK of YwqJK toxin-antitoxin module